MNAHNETVLAFDLGASSGRAIIGQYEIGDDGLAYLRIEELHRFPNQGIQVGKHYHWDILRIFQELKIGFRKAFQEGYQPATFGVDTWGVDFGLLDRDGELIGNPYHYRDPQTEGLIEELNALIGREALFAQSGLQFMPFNTIYQLYAMRKAASPKLTIAETLLLTPDLLVFLLTGKPYCEYTMATTTQLYHPVEKKWNKELMDRLGIPSDLFLDVVRPGTLLAPLSPEVCEEMSIPPVTGVAVATHDTESAVVAIPADAGPFCYLVCGTWSLLGTEQPDPVLSREAMDLEFSNEGGAGDRYQLLKNIMGLWILQECKREWEENGRDLSYSQLVQEAEASEPFRSLLQPDDLRFYGPGGMIGKVQDYCRETGQPVPETPGQIVRCILESLALRYKQAIGQAERLTGNEFSGLHMVGGGIQNELLCQFTADALNRPVWAGPVEASAIGNVLMQLIALGRCADLQEARQLVARSFPITTYEPNASLDWSAAYERFERFG